ncbi:MAG: hypothetical protein ABII79_05220 [bacterium]
MSRRKTANRVAVVTGQEHRRLYSAVESFICAGSSALLISAAQLHPEVWFLSIVALVPFLGRVIRASRAESLLLGVILATCYALVARANDLWIAPGPFLLKFLVLNLVFCIYALAVNRLKKTIGFHVIFVAALWLPLEYLLDRVAGIGSIFTLAAGDSSFVIRIGSLFGMLMISFVVVIANSLIVILLKELARVFKSGRALVFAAPRRSFPTFPHIHVQRRWYCFPDRRAPPLTHSPV